MGTLEEVIAVVGLYVLIPPEFVHLVGLGINY